MSVWEEEIQEMTMELEKALNRGVVLRGIYFGENKPGQLHQIFSDFATNKINLSLIESRPSKKEYGDYVFFLNFDGHQDDANAKSVLKNIKKNTAKLMIFGSFPIVKV